MKDTPENRKKLGIPLKADINWIDLDEQQKPPEVVTAGWTDTQIEAKSLGDIDLMIKQNEMAAEQLQQSWTQQMEQVNKLKQVRHRKLILGG